MSLPVALLAGGLATRIRPITEKIPKALVEINGEPFINYQLRLLKKHGIKKVVICAGYKGEMIEDLIGNGVSHGLQVEYSYDWPLLLGTAGALKLALPKLGDAFFVLYGDSYLRCDYQAIGQAFQASGQPALMTVFFNEGRWDTSNVEFKDSMIAKYSKTDKNERLQYIDYGLGAFKADIFTDVPVDQPTDLAMIYENLAAAGQLTAYECSERFYEVGSFTGIDDLANHLQEQAA